VSYDVWKRDAGALRRYALAVLREVERSERSDQHARLALTVWYTRPMAKAAERACRRWEREVEVEEPS
jgi:hypothetical protein